MSPVYSLIIILPAYYLVHILSKYERVHEFRRYNNLDGLRGFAALSVFVSHSAIYYYYLRTGIWFFPTSSFSSSFYDNCGAGAVAMFFMMSAFLFYGKVREQADMDWIRLYTSRVFRLFPMYYLSSILGIFMVYFGFSKNGEFTLHDIGNILRFQGVPDMFGAHMVTVITNGTAWSLPYEWTLYISLPLIWLILHRKLSSTNILLCLLALLLAVSYMAYAAKIYRLYWYFVSGLLAYEISVSKIGDACKSLATTGIASISVLIVSVLIVSMTYGESKFLVPNSYLTSGICLALYSYIFIIFALGNDMFGILSSNASRKLGEISYSLYLLQFLVLGLVFQITFSGQGFLPLGHFAISSVAGLILIVLSHFSFSYVEKNAMAQVSRSASALRDHKFFKPFLSTS